MRKVKFTLFIRNNNGHWKGVKSRPALWQLWSFVDGEYSAYKERGRMFIGRETRSLIWQPTKRGK